MPRPGRARGPAQNSRAEAAVSSARGVRQKGVLSASSRLGHPVAGGPDRLLEFFSARAQGRARRPGVRRRSSRSPSPRRAAPRRASPRWPRSSRSPSPRRARRSSLLRRTPRSPPESSEFPSLIFEVAADVSTASGLEQQSSVQPSAPSRTDSGPPAPRAPAPRPAASSSGGSRLRSLPRPRLSPSTAESSERPSSVRVYMTSLPSRRERTIPSERKRPHVVRDEVLRAPGDPGEVAHAKLPALPQGRRQPQTCRVRKRLGLLGRAVRRFPAQKPLPNFLRARSVQTE